MPAAPTPSPGPNSPQVPGPLKGLEGRDDTSSMRSCPHCGGEIKASVIRCVHCGTSLLEGTEPATVPEGSAVGTDDAAGPGLEPAREHPPGFMPGRPTAPPPSVFDPPKARSSGDPWITPSVRADGHAPLLMLTEAVPLPVPAQPRRRDAFLMTAGLIAIVASVVAFSAVSLPWVTGRISEIGQRSNTRLVAELTFRASDSLASELALGVGAVMTLLGLLWFWYAMDAGTRLPAIAHPALAVAASVLAAATLGASRFGSFFWGDAFVAHAREVGLTKDAMRSFLEGHTAPLIELEQLSGVVRFSAAAALAVISGLVAWWSQRRRWFA